MLDALLSEVAWESAETAARVVVRQDDEQVSVEDVEWLVTYLLQTVEYADRAWDRIQDTLKKGAPVARLRRPLDFLARAFETLLSTCDLLARLVTAVEGRSGRAVPGKDRLLGVRPGLERMLAEARNLQALFLRPRPPFNAERLAAARAAFERGEGRHVGPRPHLHRPHRAGGVSSTPPGPPAGRRRP
jgi:hypothetical protein